MRLLILALRYRSGAKFPIILAVSKVAILAADYKKARVESRIKHDCRSLQMCNVDSIHHFFRLVVLVSQRSLRILCASQKREILTYTS